MKRNYRRFCAVLLMLCLLCGCAAGNRRANLTLPGEAAEASQTAAAPTVQIDTTQKKIQETVFHLEYGELPLSPLQCITALTALDEGFLAGGLTEDAAALLKGDFDANVEKLPLPEGAEYLYALDKAADGSIWLLSGSVPAAYFDASGRLQRQEPDESGHLELTQYDASLAMQETISLSMTDTGRAERYVQLLALPGGFCILSASFLVLLDADGQELARQTLDTDDGWRFSSMQEVSGTLYALTRNFFGAEEPKLRKFDEETLSPLESAPMNKKSMGLGRALDGRLLIGSEEELDAYDPETAQTETPVSMRELGVQLGAEQLIETAEGYLLYTPSIDELSVLRWTEGQAPVKTLLSLAIVTGVNPVLSPFTEMLQSFNRSQSRYLVEYTIYSEKDLTDTESMELLRTQIMAGQAPDLYAFYSNGLDSGNLRPEAVGVDLLPLLEGEITKDSFAPNLYDLLTKDGALYELPLTLEVDTMLAPSRFFKEPGVTLDDLERARAQLPEGWVALDSWNTADNLFGLCVPVCIGSFTDRETGACSFDSKEFGDYLTWCKTWGGDGSTPSAPETTLVQLGWISSLMWLSGRGETLAGLWGEPGYTYIGYPTQEGTGSAYRVLTSLGVSGQCRDMDGAREFLSYCFSYLQDDALPANFALLQAEMDEYLAGNRTGWWGEELKITPEDAEQFYALLDAITVLAGSDAPLGEILREEAAGYFADSVSLEQAQKNIQSRASVYLQEQYPRVRICVRNQTVSSIRFPSTAATQLS